MRLTHLGNKFLKFCSLLIFSSLCLSGCMGGAAGITGAITNRVLDWAFEPDPTEILLKISGSDSQNPTESGRASPVVVRSFELTSIDEFENARFFALYSNAKDTLGGTLLDNKEFIVPPCSKLPCKTIEHMIAAKPETQFLGVLAAYRDLVNAQWKTFIAIERDTTTELQIQLEGNTVSIVAQED